MMDEPDDQQDAVRGADNAASTDNAAQEADSEGGDVAVLPLSVCPGMDLKPGDRLTFTVERVLQDEFLARYVSKPKGGEAASSGEPYM